VPNQRPTLASHAGRPRSGHTPPRPQLFQTLRIHAT
jgi:hypothetical protein